MGAGFAYRIDSQVKARSQTDSRKELSLSVSPSQFSDTEATKLLKLLRYWGLEFATHNYVLSVEKELIFIDANVAGN